MSATLSTGCLLSYGLEEPSGSPRLNAVDPANYALTEHGSVPRVAVGLAWAAQFPGTAGNFLSLTGYPILNRGDATWTIAGWVNFTAIADGQYLLSVSNGDNTHRVLEIYAAFGGYLAMNLGRGDPAGNYLGGGFGAGGGWVFGDWYPIQAYYDHAGQKIGIKVGTSNNGNAPSIAANSASVDTTANPILTTNGKLRLGTNSLAGTTTYGDLFHGALKNCSLWGRLLSDQEWADFQAGGNDFVYPFGGAMQAPPSPPQVITGAAHLTSWASALNTASAVAVDVAVIGDSLTYGIGGSNNQITAWPQVLQRALQALYGGGGQGLYPASNFPQIVNSGASTDHPSQPFLTNGFGNNRSVAGGWGVNGYNYGLLHGQSCTVPNQYGDTYDVFALDGPDTAPFLVQVGSDTPVSIGATQGSYGINRYRVTSTLGYRDVTINGPTSAAGGLYAQFVGVAARVGNAGVNVHTCAYVGATAAAMVGSANLMALAAALPNLRLVVLALTTNDWGQQTDLTAYQATLDAAIRHFQALPTAPSIVLVAGNPGFTTPAVPQTSYNAVLYTLATTYNCCVLDMYNYCVTGAYSDEDGLNFAGTVHFVDKGYAAMAAQAAQALIKQVTGAAAPHRALSRSR